MQTGEFLLQIVAVHTVRPDIVQPEFGAVVGKYRKVGNLVPDKVPSVVVANGIRKVFGLYAVARPVNEAFALALVRSLVVHVFVERFEYDFEIAVGAQPDDQRVHAAPVVRMTCESRAEYHNVGVGHRVIDVENLAKPVGGLGNRC